MQSLAIRGNFEGCFEPVHGRMIIAKEGSGSQVFGGMMDFRLSDLLYEIEAILYQLFT